MKLIYKNVIFLIVMLFTLFFFSFLIKKEEPWKKDQLMEPSELADIINAGKVPMPLIVNIGPAGLIKGAIDIGPAQEGESLENLKKLVISSDNDCVVIYCGCCPFNDCPNIRPAFHLLKDLNVKKPYLLNIEKNLKVNWIEKGYPLEQ